MFSPDPNLRKLRGLRGVKSVSEAVIRSVAEGSEESFAREPDRSDDLGMDVASEAACWRTFDTGLIELKGLDRLVN